MQRLWKPVLIAWLALLPLWAAAQRRVEAFNTYEAAPFLLKQGQAGLAPDLVRLLNRQLGAHFQLELFNVPRQRLIRIHLDPIPRFAGTVLFLAPAFIGDADRQLYLWSEPLFEDRNILALPRTKAPAVLDTEWLKGRHMVGVRGQRYAVLDPLLADGRLKLIEVSDERSALKMVLLARADFTQMNQLMFHQLVRELGLQDDLVAVPEPGGGAFQRRILVGRGAPELLAPLNEAIAALHCEPEWLQLAQAHGFTAPPCKKPKS